MLTPLLLGFAVALALGLASLRWVGPQGWMDHPDARKGHPRPTPRTGGLALWAAVILGQALGLIHLPITPGEWMCLHGLALVGALDDRFNLRSRVKAIAGLGLGLALAIPMALAFAADRAVAVFLGIAIPLHPPILATVLLTLWFWALPQAFNLIDGMDGLAIGTALIAYLALGLDFAAGEGAFLLGALVATGALNWPRARHFLGDCGAYLLGGLLALVALKTRAFIYPSHALWLFAYPVLDTFQVVLIRFLLGRPLGMGDRNHLHHHWARVLGSRSAWTVPLLWIQMIALATRPLHLPGSAGIAWGTLAAVLIQILWFTRRALDADRRDASPG